MLHFYLIYSAASVASEFMLVGYTPGMNMLLMSVMRSGLNPGQLPIKVGA